MKGIKCDLCASLVAKMELALQYIEHPDVQSIPFSLPASVVAERMRETIRLAKGKSL